MAAVKLAEVFRGGILDCVHYGSCVVVNSKGEILYGFGDTDRITFFRSSFKPLQAMVALGKGAVEKFNLELSDVALIVSSHSGEKEHIEGLKRIMQKIDINEDALECGIHEPYGKEALQELHSSGQKATRLHCNCSGKHMGMLAAVKLMGLNTEGYSGMEHGIQEEVGKIIKDFCKISSDKVQRGVDGCGIPVYALPLKNMAWGFANLCNTEFMDGKYLTSQNYVISAMTMYPEMVAGKGRFDTELMKVAGDRLISKMGAEGVYCAGLINKGIGMAIKIEDGNNRALAPVIIELLRKIGVINKEEYDGFRDLRNPPILNHKGEKVGEIRAAGFDV